MAKLSTVIITYNESKKIERCIESIKSISDEIIVLDSFSTDNTVNLAQGLGAIIFKHQFLGYIKQREKSISFASNDLVLALDADEYIDSELRNEIISIKEKSSADCYKLNRLSSINGHWIRHGSWHPDRIVRLFHKEKITNGGEPPHDKIIPKKGSQVLKLKGLLCHDAHDSKADRIDAIRNHSRVAAETKFAKGVRSSIPKKWIKTFWKFTSEYLLKLGFLDGYYGWFAAKTTAQYIYLRESKIRALQKLKKQ